MKTMEVDPRLQNGIAEARREQEGSGWAQHERWAQYHVNWTAVWIGALAAFSMVLLFGLIGMALGAYPVGPEHRIVDVRKLSLWTLIFSVCGAFFASVVGGWVAVKIAGILHSEPAMLHGAFTWLVLVPILVVCGCPRGIEPLRWLVRRPRPNRDNEALSFIPTRLAHRPLSDEIAAFRVQQGEYNRNVQQWREDTPKGDAHKCLGGDYCVVAGPAGKRDRRLAGIGRADEFYSLSHP